MMEKIPYKYHYLYKITNRLNGKFYVGIHSTDNLNDGYMGSGFLIRKALRKYGKNAFSKEILEFFDSREEASEAERRTVTESLINQKDCYNMKSGGDVLDFKGGHISEKLRQQWSKTKKGVPQGPHSESTKQKIRVSASNKVWVTKGTYSTLIKRSELNAFLEQGYVRGRGIGKPEKGHVCFVNNGTESKQILTQDLQKYIDSGWKRGRIGAPNSGKKRVLDVKTGKVKFI